MVNEKSDKKKIEIHIPKNRLDSKQEMLYKYLSIIGSEIASFYLDALNIIKNKEIETKSNLVAHLAREIDGGLRDILASKSVLDENKSLSKEEKKELINEINLELRSKNLTELKNISGTIISICNALDIIKDKELIKKWSVVSAQFHRFAHRSGAFKEARDFNLFKDVWERYEKILSHLIGSSLNMLNRIDNLILKDKPSSEIIRTLPNLFKISTKENYFFSNLKQINWLKPLNEAGFFNPEDNPKPKLTEDKKGYYILSWSVLRYLEWVSENLPPDNEGVVKELVKIIDAIINYKDKDGKRIQNWRTDFAIFKILNNIPSDYIKNEHIDFIKDSLEINFHGGLIGSELSKGFLSKLIADNKKDLFLRLVEVICSYRILDYNLNPLIEEYWFSELIKKHKTELAKYSAKEIIEKIVDVIKEIKKGDPNSFNIVHIPTIESHEQKSFPDKYEARLIDLFVECFSYLDDKILIKEVKKLLDHEFDIFRRVGIYSVSLNFNVLNELFFSLDDNPLENARLKHEIYELFKSHADKFSEKQIKIIIKWIEEKKYYLDEVKPKDKKKILAYHKKIWYFALLSSKNKEIKKLYEKYNKINDIELEHPGFTSWHTTWTGEVSPLQEFELAKTTIDEIIVEIKKFKEEKGFQKPSIRGFAEAIQKDVEKNPSKYYDSLEKFKDIDLAYLCTIVRAFIDISRNNNQAKKEIAKLDWDKILKFIDKQLNKSFWELEYSGEFNYRDWFISEVANLIEEGTKQDETAFDTKLLPIAKKILLNLTQHTIFYSIGNEDYVTFALNSTEGKILDAMLNYSLRFYRVVEKKWDEEIKKHFTKRITEKKYLEVFTIIGQYLPQFYTLDKKWIESNFDLIFPLDNFEILKASSSGLFFNPTVYSDFYTMFKDKGQYKLFLDSWEQNGNKINESVLRHICLGYAEKWEEIEDGTLIKKLLEKPGALGEVIRFFWIASKNIKPDYVIRIKELWQYIYENNKELQITGELMQWLRVFDELDDDLFKLCIEGAKFVNTHDVHYVIEYLVKYIDSDVEKAGKILLELVENVEIISEYKKEDVIKIVEKLYLEGKKDLADEICNKYFDKYSFEFLRGLYNANNSNVE